MVVCNRLNDIPTISQSALTIGSFDGIHVGHLEILKKIKKISSLNKSKSVVITFDPHPKTVLRPDLLNERYLITTLEKKIEIFHIHGIDCVLILQFDNDLAMIEADIFLKDIIIHYFKPHDMVVGYDHHFGHNRIGDINLLNTHSEKYAYKTHKIEQVTINEKIVCSTEIRKALASENIMLANQFLGWYYELKGIVEKGDGLGGKIGFPTANIKPIVNCQIIPSNGVYNVDVMIDDELFSGMCNVGKRPTINGTDNRIEVNVFTHKNLNLYSKIITIIFKGYLRNEKKFSSIDELKAQLRKDKKRCLEIK